MAFCELLSKAEQARDMGELSWQFWRPSRRAHEVLPFSILLGRNIIRYVLIGNKHVIDFGVF